MSISYQRTLLATVALMAAQSVALAQQPSDARGPTLPPRGTITFDAAHERAVLDAIKAPDGFDLKVFAGPPVAMYPTVVAPSPDGSVYVGVDLNLAQGAVKGRGRVMRLVDADGDGHAESYTTFVDVDSPRGIIADGKTVYVLHPPNLTAYRDNNGDGIADDSTDIVKRIGFGLDIRSSDHATNNITLGPDGWIYIAVGDYGYLNATGTDGRSITRHGGSLARVRPDGTGLEMWTVGTRNIYDVGIDPLGRPFTRDNTNDGGGWDTRFHYLAPGANMGYPDRFRYFRSEHMPSIADYGAGSGTAGLWIQDPGFPADWNNTLYTGDWTVNRVFRHRLTPKGASFGIEQQEFMTVPRAIDMAMDDRSHLYVASLIGGVFNYAGDTVGAIVRVTPRGTTLSTALNPERATPAQLLDAVVSANAMHRVWAQQELVRRGSTPATVTRLGTLLADPKRSADARASAIFTLARVAGPRSVPVLLRAANDPVTREVALRTLVDVGSTANVPLFVTALRDTNPEVRVQALRGLSRFNAVAQATAIVPLLTSPDSALAHLATRALVALGARDVALRALTAPGSSPALRTRARFVLQELHDGANVTALLGALGASPSPDVRRELLLTLARLYNTDAQWTGDWWGTHPSTLGPYFAPVASAESGRIRPVLRDALAASTGADRTALTESFVRNRVLPAGAGPLIVALGASGDALGTQSVDALLGTATITPAAVPFLTQLDARGGTLHSAVAELLAGEEAFDAQTMPLARAAAIDSKVDAAARGRLLTAVSQLPTTTPPAVAAELFAAVTPPLAPAGAAATTAEPVEAAWRRYVGDRRRMTELDYFITVARTGTPAMRTLAYAVLAQAIRSPRTPPPVRDQVAPVIEAAWTDPASTPSLVQAIALMRLESQYADRLKTVPNATPR